MLHFGPVPPAGDLIVYPHPGPRACPPAVRLSPDCRHGSGHALVVRSVPEAAIRRRPSPGWSRTIGIWTQTEI